MITLHIYRKSDGVFLYSDSSLEDWVLSDIDSDNDFTLTRPPDYKNVWRWIDNKWIADNTAN